MGKIRKIDVKRAQVEHSNSMKRGADLPNCGLQNVCSADSIAVHLYTGQGSEEGPKICVGGK